MTTFDGEGGCLSSAGGGVSRSETEEEVFTHPPAFGHPLQKGDKAQARHNPVSFYLPDVIEVFRFVFVVAGEVVGVGGGFFELEVVAVVAEDAGKHCDREKKKKE